jgi:uncharacterized protein (TIGR03067 family)
MFRTTWAALAAVALGTLAVATAQEKGDADQALKQLQGSWTVVKIEEKGKSVPEEAIKKVDMKLVVKGDKYSQVVQGTALEEGTLKLDPSKKPAAMDLTITSGKDKGKTQRGIYELKDDTLRIHFGRPGSDKRPTAFMTKEDEEGGMLTFRRDKK